MSIVLVSLRRSAFARPAENGAPLFNECVSRVLDDKVQVNLPARSPSCRRLFAVLGVR